MKMRDAQIGELVFLEENMNDERTMEVRETYYRRTANGNELLGLAQGDPTLMTPRYDEEGRLERPRYFRVKMTGREYPLVGALPVKPISQSRFIQYCDEAALQKCA